MMDWTPIVFGVFKVLVFSTGVFFAIKWHYDQGKKGKEMRAVLPVIAKVGAVFMLSALGLLLFTFVLGRKLGLDLTFQ